MALQYGGSPRQILEANFPAFAASLFFKLGYWRVFYPWGGPMNGQTARLEIAREIIVDCGVCKIVETGTFRGVTTEWFAEFQVPVATIETHPSFFAFARLRLKRFPKVAVHFGSSADILPKLNTQKGQGVTFYYLDAHWENYLPLKEELETIFQADATAIIMIDDFKVPDDSTYKYDDYGPGKSLDVDYLKTARINPPFLFFPRVKGSGETGAKRGCVVITVSPETSLKLEALPMLRRWPAS